MKRLTRFGTLIAVGVVTVLAFQNCGKLKSSPQEESLSSQGAQSPPAPVDLGVNACNLSALQASSGPVKVIFAVDASGSNETSQQGIGTDIGKVARSLALSTFYGSFAGQANFDWTLIAFKESMPIALVNSGSTLSPTFSNDPAKWDTAFSEFKTMVDEMSTPYRSTLAMVSDLIAQDTLAPVDTQYVVAFLSDGLPTDYNMVQNVITSAGEAALLSDVQKLKDIKPGQVSINTIYYGHTNAKASNLMQQMSVTGGGQFLNALEAGASADTWIYRVATAPMANCAP